MMTPKFQTLIYWGSQQGRSYSTELFSTSRVARREERSRKKMTTQSSSDTTTCCNDKDDNHRPSCLFLSSIGETLLSVILSYCSAPDLVSVLDIDHPLLIQAAKLALTETTSLHFSYLLQLDRCRNHGSGKNTENQQEICIEKILNAIVEDNHNKDNGVDDNVGEGRSSNKRNNKKHYGNAKIERIEFAGLRHIVGGHGNWLSRLFASDSLRKLHSIDFSGCAMLDPRMLHAALTHLDGSQQEQEEQQPILYLNFQGCYRIDAQIVNAIADSPIFQNLQSLGLGGCSQSIADESVYRIITKLRKLRFLDLSGLKRITEHCCQSFQLVPSTLESLELAGCELLRFTCLKQWSSRYLPRLAANHGGNENRDGNIPHNRNNNNNNNSNGVDVNRLTAKFWEANQHLMTADHYPAAACTPLKNLTRINFNGMGTPRRGLCEGALPYFALRSMGSLREVYLSGCEQVQDWEIEVLARVCAQSLTCLEMRACCIGDDAVRAVGLYCTNLSDVDFSACFQVTDQGILSFSQYQGTTHDAHSSNVNPASRKRSLQRSTVRSLKIAALPQLTNKSVEAIAALESLIVLDISNCPMVTPDALSETVKELPSLVELDAKGIGKWSSSVAALYSYDDEPRYLRFVNGRPFHANKQTCNAGSCFEQCIVRQHSKRLNYTQGVPLQPMYHCVDCKLIPSLNRGMCHACSVHCHKDHAVFVGSFTRFYCDCPFGIAGKLQCCEAISCGQQAAVATCLPANDQVNIDAALEYCLS